jgi:hypothetical protein
MSLLDSIRYRLRVFGSPRLHEHEAAEEAEFHVDLETMQREHASRGVTTRRDARDAARKRFGNSTYYREETRRASGLSLSTRYFRMFASVSARCVARRRLLQ